MPREAQIEPLVFRENILDLVIEAIIAAARTEKIGDGKIFVYDVESIYRIRTGETDQDAL